MDLQSNPTCIPFINILNPSPHSFALKKQAVRASCHRERVRKKASCHNEFPRILINAAFEKILGSEGIPPSASLRGTPVILPCGGRVKCGCTEGQIVVAHGWEKKANMWPGRVQYWFFPELRSWPQCGGVLRKGRQGFRTSQYGPECVIPDKFSNFFFVKMWAFFISAF